MSTHSLKMAITIRMGFNGKIKRVDGRCYDFPSNNVVYEKQR